MQPASRGALIAAVTAIFAVASCVPARAAQRAVPGTYTGPTALAAVVGVAGVINLEAFGRAGSRVYFDERVGTRAKRLGSTVIGPFGRALLPEATVWRCDRLVRSFELTAVAPDASRTYGSYDVRTPSCRTRFEVHAPRRMALRKSTRIRVVDGWAIGGITTRLCITPPGDRQACKKVRLAPAVSHVSRGFRATKRGVWRVVLRVKRFRVRARIAVGASAPSAPRLPVVLATGDSMIQGVDSFLADRLADRANVHSDVRLGAGVSLPFDWVKRARADVKRHHQLVTVVSLGAADTFSMQTPAGATVDCCGQPWVVEYVRRLEGIMKAYIQNGRARVFWMAVPAARDKQRSANAAIVNAAIRQAAKGLPGANVVPLDQVFTPFGYREVMRWHGRDVDVRAPDGGHLSAAGTAIAAEVIEAAIGDL